MVLCIKRILRDFTPSIKRIIIMQFTPQWIVGFVDGEGCFCISAQNMPSMNHGKQIRLVFKVSQHKNNIKVLYALKAYFGVGIVKAQSKDSDIMEFTCSRFEHIQNIIIPFFEKNKLRTAKQFDFFRFRKASILITRKEHLTLEGLEKIEKLRGEMTSKGVLHEFTEAEIDGAFLKMEECKAGPQITISTLKKVPTFSICSMHMEGSISIRGRALPTKMEDQNKIQ
jgi:hypothetical protein